LHKKHAKSFGAEVNMEIFQNVSALLRVTIVFILVLFSIRKKLSLGNAFLMATIFLGVLFDQTPLAIFKSILASIVYPKTLALAFIVGFILILSNSMELAGQMQRLLEKFRGLVSSSRLNLIIFPALIGLLPMPGGAVFSAPMVKELGAHSGLSRDQLSFVNYWFRHIWEYWWPMYPGVLLATVMADINIAVFVICLFPLTLVAVHLGGRSIKGFKQFGEGHRRSGRPAVWPFIRELLPILIVIIPGLSLGVFFSFVFPKGAVSKELGLICSLLMAIGWIWYENRFSKSQIRQVLYNKHILKMMYMVFAILIFKGLLQDSHAVEAISDELMALKIPIVLVAALLPFIVGVVTGITIAFVGSTLPILIPLIHAHGEGEFMLAYVMLMLVSGFAGVLLSPLHFCLILSNEYFDTPPGPVYRYLWMPCVGLLFSGMVYFWLLYGLYQWN
jgi:integral membrane protein (TIGR00529 family)